MGKRDLKRLFNQIAFFRIRNGYKKAQYIKKHHLFMSIGDNVAFTSSILPAEPFLVSIGNNVIIAAGVRLITHSTEAEIFNVEEHTDKYYCRFGEIKIGNNVFIGADTIILPNVSIGDNVVIAAGSIVTSSVESNIVTGGVPARKICSYDELKEKNKTFSKQFENYTGNNEVKNLYNYLKEKNHEK